MFICGPGDMIALDSAMSRRDSAEMCRMGTRSPWDRPATSRIMCLLLYALLIGSCGKDNPGRAKKSERTRPLSVAIDSEVLTLDPHRYNETITLSVLENMFESLVAQDANLRVVPALATGWETPDDLTWRVHIRRNVRFHDGTEMTSADVKFSYDRVLSSPDSGLRNFLNAVRSVEIIDAYTVDVKLNTPCGVVANLGAIYILPADDMRTRGENRFFESPVGTGPYRFSGWKKGERVWMHAFDGYWGGPSAFELLEFRTEPDREARRRMLESGEADIALNISTPSEPPLNYRTYNQPDLHLHYIALDAVRRKTPYVNLPANPLTDTRVRRAILLGIDTEGLIRDVLGRSGYRASQLVTPSVFGFDPTIRRPEPDPEAARRLLAGAGYPGGFGLTLDLQPNRRAVAEYIRQSLEKIGIRLSLNVVSKDVFYDKLNRRDTSAYYFAISCTSGDSSEVFEYGLHTPDPSSRLGIRNIFRYSNRRIDDLLLRSHATRDERERLGLLQQAMRIVMEDLPWIPVYIPETVYGISKSISFTPRLDDHVLGWDAKPAE